MSLFPVIKEISLKPIARTMAQLLFSWVDKKTKTVVFAQEEEGKIPSSAIWLGKVGESNPNSKLYNYNLWLSTDFPSIIMIYGRRGTGKSYSMGVIVEGLMSQNNDVSITPPSYALLMIDTLGQFWQTKYPPPDSEKEQIGELHKWNLKARGFSNLQVFVPRGTRRYEEDWGEFSIAISDLDLEDWCGLLQVDRFSDRIGQLMSLVYEKVLIQGYVHAERDAETGEIIPQSIRDVESNPQYNSEDLLDCLDYDREINSKTMGFERQTIRALRSRIEVIKTWRVLSEDGTPLDQIFKKGILTVINLSEADYSLKSLIAGILIKKIFKERQQQRNQEELNKVKAKKNESESIPPGWIFIDEAHNYCPEREITSCKEWLIRYAKEGRSLGLGLVGTTQQPSALSSKLSSQINVLICHGLSFAQDISAVEDRILNNMLDDVSIKGEKIESNILPRILRILDRGEVMISSTGVNRVFLAKVRPRIAAHGGAPPKIQKQ